MAQVGTLSTSTSLMSETVANDISFRLCRFSSVRRIKPQRGLRLGQMIGGSNNTRFTACATGDRHCRSKALL